MNVLATEPSRSDWIGYIVGFPMFACIAVIPLMLILLLFNSGSLTGRGSVMGVMMCLSIGLIVAGGFTWYLVNRHYWILTDNELIRGIGRRTVLRLDSLQKIIVGLPTQFPLPLMENLTSPELRQHFIEQQKVSLLLVLADGIFLPLNLHAIPNGTRLMTELVSRFPQLVDYNYSYSEEEIKWLKKKDLNVVVKKDR